MILYSIILHDIYLSIYLSISLYIYIYIYIMQRRVALERRLTPECIAVLLLAFSPELGRGKLSLLLSLLLLLLLLSWLLLLLLLLLSLLDTTEKWNSVGKCHRTSVGKCHWNSALISEVLTSGVQSFSEGGMIRLSSSDLSIRAFRAYPLIEIRQTVPCRAIRGDSISVICTLPPSFCLSVFLSFCLSIYLSIHLSIYIHATIHIHISIHLKHTYTYNIQVHRSCFASRTRAGARPPRLRSPWRSPQYVVSSVHCFIRISFFQAFINIVFFVSVSISFYYMFLSFFETNITFFSWTMLFLSL